MNKMTKLIGYKDLINELFIYNLSYVKEYSFFLYETLLNNWVDIYKNNKKNKNKITKNINKLRELEEKKKKEINYIDSNKKYLEGVYNTNSKKIIEYLAKKKSLSMYLEFLVNEYFSMNGKKVVMPKKKGTPLYKYLVLDNNIYMHIKQVDGIIKVDKESFNNEVKMYKNDDFTFETPNIEGATLSPFEKKRRIYVNSMHDLEKNLRSLNTKQIDITHPVEKYYKYANIIIDNLYKNIMDYRDNKVLYQLYNMTIKSYGENKLNKLYDLCSLRLINEMDNVDQVVSEEYWNEIDSIREKNDYLKFKDVKTIVPTILDIYTILNEKIINNVGVNIDRIVNNVKYCTSKFTYYMSVPEIVRFYYTVVECFRIERINTNKFITFRNYVGEIIAKRMSISLEEALDKYLN